MKYAMHAACLLAGLAGGWALAQWSADRAAPATSSTPTDWVARVGDDYVTAAEFEAEMRQRGGTRPGLFQDEAQRRALLDDMLLHRALVAAARRDGIADEPETRRSIEQLLTSQYLRNTLRREQRGVSVSEAELKEYFEDSVDSYTVPARRRVAMIRIGVAKDADAATWKAAEQRAAEALAKARAQASASPHFGAIAREYSEDQSSRYRGGVIGWLTEGRREGYRHDPAVIDAAFELARPGEFSAVVRGADGVYVARLVELQAEQKRDFEQLRAGLEQRLMQERLAEMEKTFRDRTLAAAAIEVREARLAQIAPPGPPAPSTPPEPPPMPTDAGAGS
jgi:peptidyl-prolyl cis-trans isomerase C